MCWAIPLILRRRLEHIEERLTVRPYFENARGVATPIAIVRGAPYGRQSVLEQDGEALHAKLVSPKDMMHIVGRQELPHDT